MGGPGVEAGAAVVTATGAGGGVAEYWAGRQDGAPAPTPRVTLRDAPPFIILPGFGNGEGGLWWLLVAAGGGWLVVAGGGCWWWLACGGWWWLMVAVGCWWVLVAAGGGWLVVAGGG